MATGDSNESISGEQIDTNESAGAQEDHVAAQRTGGTLRPGFTAIWLEPAAEQPYAPEPGAASESGRRRPARPRRRGAVMASAMVAAVVVAAGVVFAAHPWPGGSTTTADHVSEARVAAPPPAEAQPTFPPVSSTPAAPAGRPRRGGPQTPAAPAGGSADAVAAKVIPGLVNVHTTLGTDGEAAGTGIVLTASGEVLTNHHVIQGSTSIKVDDLGNGRSYTATVVGYDASADIAVLQLDGASNLTTVVIGDSGTVAVGDPVLGIGNAGGTGIPSVVAGRVTGLNRSITATDADGANPEYLTGLIQTDAALEPGDSGGPLVDASGRVIGVDSAGSGRLQVRQRMGAGGEGYAVPINAAMAIVKQIASGKSSATIHLGASGYLGITLARAQGTTVASVQPGSPAGKAGITAGDSIVSINGQAVDSAQALTTALSTFRPNDRVKVTWVDAAGKAHTSEVGLATGPVR